MSGYRPTESVQDQAVHRELQRIARAFGPVALNNIRLRAVAPEKPTDGDSAICDGATWNPLGDGVKRPVWFNGNTQLWEAFGGGGSGSAAWGGITGTLSLQTDLQAALDAKANASHSHAEFKVLQALSFFRSA